MSLIDLASLVLAPTATKEGKVYSAIPDTGEGDMTFTRGSAATRVNSAGLIEKERGNLLLQSNTFNTTWSVIRSSVTSGASDPFGGSNAWSFLTDTTADDQHYIYQVISQSGVGTLSIYAKANGYNWLRLRLPSEEAFFDLANGVTGSSTTGISASITDVGSGWYRCEVAISDMSSNPNVFIHIAEGDGDVVINGTPSGTDGLYIYAAQLNQGLVAQSYIPTTTSAVYEGITDDVPRVDYSGGGCPSLLLEGQRTNSYTNSEYFDDWLSNRLDRTANNIISPEGVQNAYKMTQQSGFTTAPNINKGGIAAGTYTVSIFAKKGSWNYLAISFQGVSYFNLEAGSKGTINSNHTATIEDYGNGWYRCAITRTTTTTQTPAFYFAESDNTLTTPDTQGYMYAYGAMLEAGSYSTSYIPTYSVSSTRVADSCSKTGISELIGQTEGTMFLDFKLNKVNLPNNHTWIAIKDLSQNNRILIYMLANQTTLRGQIKHSGTAYNLSFGTITDNQNIKIAFAYKSGDSAVYINGSSVATDTNTLTFGTMDIFDFNDSSTSLDGQINQAILFPTRLTNDQLEELTK